MAAGTKKRKKRMKRQLKRFKQTIVKHIEKPSEPAKEYKAHLLYPGKYAKENEQYQVQLDARYKGTVTPIERFINQDAVIIHSCSDCKKEFYAKPRWLVDGVQPHDCKTTGGIKKGYTDEKRKTYYKINEKANEKKGASLANKLDDLIQRGVNPRQIRKETGVDIQIVEYYKEAFHTKRKRQG
ncbi:hypothetical protein MZM54_33135 [[Brevibacterium] frigoritolerans]|nr:hypothetical protein [Peribacillus frigoritolerans]